jgi:GTP-binding protein
LQIHSVVLHRAAYLPEAFPRDGLPQFAVVGRSNVGKSSFINSLVRSKIARISQTPGKTQAVHFYLINRKFYIVDLPGYGYAKVSRDIREGWGKLIESYFASTTSLQIFFLLLDARRIPSPEDEQVIEWARRSDRNIRIVMTKSDKLSRNELVKSRRAIAAATGAAAESLIAFSKLTGEGVDVVWRELTAHI